jgi:hypothetical protein
MPKGSRYRYLTEDQISHFLQSGYLHLPSCFTSAQAATFTSNMWTRLGFSPTDKSTWTRERTNMPSHNSVRVSDFAPKAWGAICELLGGADRVAEWSNTWRDSFIVNLGSPEWAGTSGKGKETELGGWHVDGDFFLHFLDSPEQALLVIPLFSDIEEDGGGTIVAPEGVGKVARWLVSLLVSLLTKTRADCSQYDHPNGVSPLMIPVKQSTAKEGLGFCSNLIKSCTEFHEMTGKVGDVILLHPLMVHSAAKNGKRMPRIIINPPVALRAPFNFDRMDESKYSLVELKTIKEIGAENGKRWKITGKRGRIVPERVRIQEQLRNEERQRLEEQDFAKLS